MALFKQILRHTRHSFSTTINQSKTVLIPVANGTEEIEAVSLIDILRRSGADVTVASVGEREVVMSRGVRLVADCLITDVEKQKFDLIACPGGLMGAENLRDCPTLIAMLKGQKSSKRLFAAICASPAVVLHAHGLLEGLDAVGYPTFQESLDFPNTLCERVKHSENCGMVFS
eukprot:CAMPEP_0115007546 /NCGR_PEP_ID=MMETSP0216-20121206/21266_1 /TAXON_ID=223996 /ORGANISM="Protocruzia adherens, Strain Boccale" /LENGTH=172 /DNA_ID=CAMNT_0002374553 /DNA_START=32 /DNA_END=550 /DNA_ORIENTATION=+